MSYPPQLGSMPRHEMQMAVQGMHERELDRALTQPYINDVGMREERAIRKELGWREQERMAAIEAHEDALRDAGFDDGLSVTLDDGLPDPVADPLPGDVVTHVEDVVTGTDAGERFVDRDEVDSESATASEDGIEIEFEVGFDEGFESGFESGFER